ncbi:MAG: hypothetical protein ABW200_01990 [Hyphomicrobiaceae bacterium]|jgi:hypothetical protein
MRGDASPAAAYHPYNSLMGRLAALGEGRDVAGERLAAAQRERRRLSTKYFSCGFVASLAIGCVGMLPAVLAHPGVRLARSQPVEVAANISRASVPLWPAHGTVAPEAEISSFELPIRRSERTNAAFPVEITGGGAARDGMTVVLRDMPESTYLSKGQRQDGSTWLLRPADLNNLRLSIYEGTPDVFDVTIEVTSATGDPAARSIARVRLLDTPALPEPPVATVDAPSARAPQKTVDAAIAPRREEPAKPRPLETAPQQKAAQKPQLVQAPRPAVRIEELRVVPRTRPEGMSTLGMATREIEADDRQLWWRAPASSWAGFSDLPGGN